MPVITAGLLAAVRFLRITLVVANNYAQGVCDGVTLRKHRWICDKDIDITGNTTIYYTTGRVMEAAGSRMDHRQQDGSLTKNNGKHAG